MKVTMIHRTELGVKYSPRAFQSQVGEEVPVVLPSGQHIIGVLEAVKVHPTGLAAELTLDIPELEVLPE